MRAGTLASVPRRSFRISDWKLCGQVWEGEIVVWQVGNDWRQTSNSGDVSVRVRLDVQKARIPMISSLRTRRYLITRGRKVAGARTGSAAQEVQPQSRCFFKNHFSTFFSACWPDLQVSLPN